MYLFTCRRQKSDEIWFEKKKKKEEITFLLGRTHPSLEVIKAPGKVLTKLHDEEQRGIGRTGRKGDDVGQLGLRRMWGGF